MLCNFLPFMFTAGIRCRATIGYFVFDGACSCFSSREFSATDVFAGSASQIVGFPYVRDRTSGIPNSILPGLGGRFLPCSGSGIILVGAAGFIC